MPSADASFFGLAEQTAKGTPNTTDADFDYILFTDGAPGPQNVVRPLDREAGGDALPRGMAKLGVMSGAEFQFIPRPHTLGRLFYAWFGKETVTAFQTDATDDSWQHDLTLLADQFDQPYYTLRSDPGGMWGEQFQDSRLATLALRWRGADFLRGAFGFQGLLPAKVATTSWAASTYLDDGPQFLTPLADIELPTLTDLKVLEGAITFQSSMPLDQQWIVGSYVPDDLDVANRNIQITMSVKIADDTLYNKMQYDPAGGSAWVASIFKEADLKLQFLSDQDIVAGFSTPYTLSIAANGQSGADANVMWSAQPVRITPGRQIVMIVTGMFLASPTVDEPITVSVTNGTAAYA